LEGSPGVEAKATLLTTPAPTVVGDGGLDIMGDEGVLVIVLVKVADEVTVVPVPVPPGRGATAGARRV